MKNTCEPRCGTEDSSASANAASVLCPSDSHESKPLPSSTTADPPLLSLSRRPALPPCLGPRPHLRNVPAPDRTRCMSPSLSAHLIKSYENRATSPFATFTLFPSTIMQSPDISYCANMSYNASMHGPQQPSFFQQSTAFGNSGAPVEISQATEVKIADLQAKLNRKLGPEFISQRPGPGGGAFLLAIVELYHISF